MDNFTISKLELQEAMIKELLPYEERAARVEAELARVRELNNELSLDNRRLRDMLRSRLDLQADNEWLRVLLRQVVQSPHLLKLPRNYSPAIEEFYARIDAALKEQP